MTTITIKYLGELRTESIHIHSGQHLITDAPLDNHGKGEAFSPTDLLATSLGTCMLTSMGISANKHNIYVNGTTCSVIKKMAASPRRVTEIEVELYFPKETKYSDEEKTTLQRAALTCPVAESLHPDLIQKVTFNFA